ncbi:MAG: cytochrome b/b6 domain-containing protein [Halioglobus sp.]
MRQHPLWDLPTRLFHWLLALCLVLSWWSGEEGEFERHEWLGYTVLVLVLFRFIWGFVGSRHSKFSDFVRGPGTVWAYVKGKNSGGRGHNPLGGWSVLLLLSVLLVQAISGLFNSDDLMFEGPFYYVASVEFRDAMGVIHELAFNVLVGLVVLHLAAVFYYQWVKKIPLLQAMIKGKSPGRDGASPAISVWRALIVIVAIAALLWWVVSLAPKPQLMW